MAKEIYVFGSGQPVRRLSLFDHLGRAPDSGPSRQSITNANKYNLIKGSYASEVIELTPDGRVAIHDEVPARERARARVRLAIEQIEPFKRLYERFVGNKLPATTAMTDAITEFDVSVESAEEAVDTFIVNFRFVSLLATLSGADRIVTIEHLLDTLPATPMSLPTRTLAGGDIERASETGKAQLVTADHAAFETTCFYITPIGEEGSEQRKHSDLFLGSFVEPALDKLGLRIVRADAIDRPGMITKQVIEYIVRSRLVVVDLSFHKS